MYMSTLDLSQKATTHKKMGRLTHSTTIHHPIHPHPLHLTSPTRPPALCSACTLPCTSLAYTCTPCSFHLHLSPCSSLPPLIHHPSHPTHPLTLLNLPAYPERYFHCDACSLTGSSFSYHCSGCSFDLHTACASLPLSVAHYAHPHPLTMAFSPPYDRKGFSCDVCGGLGGSSWLYRCALCEFDVHLGCAGGGGGNNNNNNYRGEVSRSLSQGRPGLMRQFVGSVVEGAGQQIGQSLVNGFIGGGGGGGGGGGNDGFGDGGGSTVFDVGGSILGGVLGGGDSGDL